MPNAALDIKTCALSTRPVSRELHHARSSPAGTHLLSGQRLHLPFPSLPPSITMAHKHNRRRIRHRSRRNRYEQSLPTVHETPSYDLLSSLSEPRLSFGITHSTREAIRSPSSDYSDSATLRNWLGDQMASTRYPGPESYIYRVSAEEARAIRTFGGEPGEGYSLVEHMQKMFDSMDWVDT